MKIFIMGLTSSALGGMEYHNLGNYAITEPLIVYLKKEFPNAEISTSIQMSDEFCKMFNIESKREKRFWTYGKQTAIITAIDILKISVWSLFKYIFHSNLKFILKSSVMLNELDKADLVIDFSGDLYGDNAGFNNFLEDNAEILFAKVLGKPVVMFVGSPGPFRSTWRKRLAKFVFNKVDLITNREPLSTELLVDLGVNQKHMKTTACPAFLFEKRKEAQSILEKEKIISENEKPLVGIILCGWNMPKPPHYKIPRDEEELEPFVQLVKHLIENLKVRVLLMSHQNRTDESGNLIQGNDHKIFSQLYEMLEIENYGDDLFTLKGLYDAATSKTIIGYCDMLVSGRIHGTVAGLSQRIPTVIIDYGHEPKAHKLRGFARLVGIESYVCNPHDSQDMIEKVSSAWENKDKNRDYLNKKIPEIEELAKSNFKLLHQLVKCSQKNHHMFKVRRQQVFFLANPKDINAISVVADIKFMEITFDNVEHVTDFRCEEHAAAFLRFLEEGQYGIYAWIDSKVVGHAWAKVSKKRRCKVNGYIKISQNEALIHYCNVSKSHRGKNIYPAMLAALCLRLFSEVKVRCVLIDTEVDNKAALRGIAKVGFKPLGKGTYIQFGGRLIYKSFKYSTGDN